LLTLLLLNKLSIYYRNITIQFMIFYSNIKISILLKLLIYKSTFFYRSLFVIQNF